MRDLSKISSSAELAQAINDTNDAIARGEKAVSDGMPGASATLVEQLRNELEALLALKKDKGW
ncbi:MAG: hypothetical protein JSR78_02425 [Proteobacteria bacterium]|nr:hypothetical protein [Pseudomonadota bacterium]